MNKKFAIIAMVLISSCTTTQLAKKATPLSAHAILEQSQQHSQTISWLCAQLNGQANYNQQTFPINAQLRLKKDSVMWLSLRALMGIEVARIWLSPDSIKLLNRLNSTYFLGSIDQLSSSYKLPINYEQLQDALLARLSFNPSAFGPVEVKDQWYVLNAFHQGQFQNYRLNTDFLPLEVLQSRSDSQFVKMEYIDYQNIDSLWVPKELSFHAQSDSNRLKATVNFTKTTINQPKKIKFSVPSSYVPM